MAMVQYDPILNQYVLHEMLNRTYSRHSVQYLDTQPNEFVVDGKQCRRVIHDDLGDFENYIIHKLDSLRSQRDGSFDAAMQREFERLTEEDLRISDESVDRLLRLSEILKDETKNPPTKLPGDEPVYMDKGDLSFIEYNPRTNKYTIHRIPAFVAGEQEWVAELPHGSWRIIDSSTERICESFYNGIMKNLGLDNLVRRDTF